MLAPLLVALAAPAPQIGVQHAPHQTLLGGASDLYGQRARIVGEVDGDGRDDVLVLGTRLSAPSGQVAQLHSAQGGALLYVSKQVTGHPWLGCPIDGVGDLDQDGSADLLLGDSEQGTVQVVSPTTQSVLLNLNGAFPSDGFGGAVRGVGDVDGDGLPDVLVSAVGQLVGSGEYVRLISGTGVLLREHSGSAGDHFGACLAAAGDLDLDGVLDYAIGAPGDGNDVLDPGIPPFVPPFWTDDDAGVAFAFSGATGAELWRSIGSQPLLGYAFSIDGLGDWNQDGRPDVGVGTLANDEPGTSGFAQVLSGQDGAILTTYAGEASESLSFVRVAGPGDLDLDGRPELLLSAQVGGPPGHVARALGSLGPDPLWSHTPAPAGSALSGLDVAGGGDTNGDGLPDFVLAVSENTVGLGRAELWGSVPPAPSASVVGCNVNPKGSLSVSGLPTPGATLHFQLNDPQGVMQLPSAALLFLSDSPDAATPCGTLVPGWGLASAGAVGELLIDVAAPNPLLAFGASAWTGTPLPVAVSIPPTNALLYQRFYLQGLFFNAAPQFGLTEALEITIGLP